MIRKYEDRYVTSIGFEKSRYTRLNELLPKGISITDELNEFMRQKILELEKDISFDVSTKCPIRIYENSSVKNKSVLEQQTSEHVLDMYGSKIDLVTYVQSITDSKKAWALRRNAMLLRDLADTKAKQLQKEHK